jgi:hypothetical protein
MNCTIIVTSKKEIRKHLIEKPKNLPSSSQASRLYKLNIAYQQLFQSRPASRLFKVKQQPISNAERVKELGQQRAKPQTTISSSTSRPIF